MPNELQYYHINAFTSELYSGHPIAVIAQATGLSDIDFQLIADELNVPNTVYILPSLQLARANYRLRHFNREGEVGHDDRNAFASVWIMAHDKELPTPIDGSLFYRIEIPPDETTAIEIRCQDGRVRNVFLPMRVNKLFQVQKSIVASATHILKRHKIKILSKYEILIARETNSLLVPVSFDDFERAEIDDEYLVKFFEETEFLISLFAIGHEDDETNHCYQKTFRYTSDEKKEIVVDCGDAAAAALYYHKQCCQTQDGVSVINIHQTNQDRWGHLICELMTKNSKVLSSKIGGSATIVASGKILFD